MAPARRQGLCALAMAAALAMSACDGAMEDPGDSPTDAAATPAAGVEWRQLEPVPTARTEVAAATDGSRILTAGGFASGGGNSGTVEIFDVESGTWSGGQTLPHRVDHAMAASAGGTILVLGGYTPDGLPSDRAFAMRDDGWEELPRMPEPRAAGGAAVVDGLVFVAGGVGPFGLAESVMVFDSETAEWGESLRGPPTPREHLGVAAHNGLLYVVGGRTGGIGSNLGTAEALDPSTGQWTTLPSMPTSRGGLAAASSKNGFVVAPGGEAETTFEEAEAYDVEAGTWISLPPLPTPRHGLGVVAVGTTIHVVAGGPQPGLAFSGAHEAIDLAPLR
jgi:hypothetical protein